MADVSLKEQKLAAARKKLRQYQKKKGDGHDKLPKSRESSPYLEVLNHKSETSSSRSSSVTDISESGCSRLDQPEYGTKSSETHSPEIRDSPGLNEKQICTETNPFISSSYEVPCQSSNENLDTTTSNLVHTIESLNSELIINQQGERKLLEYGEQGVLDEDTATANTVNENINLSDKFDSPEKEGSICSETNVSVTTVVHVKANDSAVQHSQDTPLRSTTESLRQLSLQMSGLVNDEGILDPSTHELTIMELEKRNNELASLLASEKQKSIEHESIIEEMKRRIESQSAQIQGLQKMTVTENNGTEVTGLREQLQVHIQTIGILVAEKSELQTSLSHVRYALDQKAGEVTELQGRLDASREHVKHLEVSNQELKTRVSSLTDSKENDSQQLLNLQSSYAKLSKLCDEMRASTAELTERLAVRSEENKKLNTELTEVRRQYELAQVHIEQLRGNSTEDLRKQFEELQLAFSNSENEVQVSKTALEQAQNEKKQMEYEYKSYTSHLATELEDLKEKFTNELKKFEELEKRKEELEADLKSRETSSEVTVSLEEVEKERSHLLKTISDATESKKLLEEQCSSLGRDNGQLSQLLSEQSAKLEALEAAADRTNTQQVNTTQLLQAMQSDKIAAARALSQNKQLKEQLEELQNGFIMMSNKKLELTEKLEKELHVKKGLYKEISQLGEELASHKEKLVAKQREIDSLKSGSSAIKYEQNLPEAINGEKEKGSDCAVSGSLHSHHHYPREEIGYVDHSKAVEEIVPGTHTLQNGNPNKEEGSAPVDKAEEVVESVDGSNQHQMEVQNHILKRPYQENEVNSDEVPLKVAQEALEKKFFNCMKDLAAVSDEKQNLEHLVQQLQLETETVGDYITIYQFQRGVMKQQMQELKSELEMLKMEKQEMICKLSKLQKLVESLATDKDAMKEGFIHGISSIINSSNREEDGEESTGNAQSNSDSGVENGTLETAAMASEPETIEKKGNEKSSKTDTVKQIMELISEMETSTQLDISALHKFHPCSHCSGKLITI